MPVYRRGIDADTYYNARVAISASVNLVGTSSAGATTAITTGPFTIDNPGAYLVSCFTPQLTRGTTNLDIELWDGATLLTSLTGHYTAAVPVLPVLMTAFVTLAAGGHNLAVKGFVDAGTGVFGAGVGTTGNQPNAWLAVQPA